MTPDFKIMAAGANITPQIKDRLISLRISDEAGTKSDMLEVTLDDRDGRVEIPLPGAPILVMLGYSETGIMPMGLFTADEVTVSAPPAQIIIRAKAAHLGGSIKEQKTRSWDKKTIGEIVDTIAGEHKLTPKVAEPFKAIKYEHIDQTDESDIHFLSRIGRDHDALVSVKGGALLFMARGTGLTVSGLSMLPRPVWSKDAASWTMTFATRENWGSVTAQWHDTASAARKEVKAGDAQPTYKLRHIYSSEQEAQQAADAKLTETKRGNDTFEVVIPGDPLIAAGGRIVTLGFRPGVDGLWSVKSVAHELSTSGFITKISTERPNQ